MLRPIESDTELLNSTTSKFVVVNSTAVPYVVSKTKTAEIVLIRGTTTSSFSVLINGVDIFGALSINTAYPLPATPITLNEGDVVSLASNNGIVQIKEYLNE